MKIAGVEYSKYKKRVVTEFICEELLYDYLVGALDAERKQAIEKALLENKTLQFQLQVMKQSLELANSLKEFDVEVGLIDDFKEVKGSFELFLDEIKFLHWPFGIRWGVEVVIVLGFVSFTLYAVPWAKLLRFENLGQSNAFILAQIDRPEKSVDATGHTQVAPSLASDPATTFKDESAKPEEPTTPSKTEVIKKPAVVLNVVPTATSGPSPVGTVVKATSNGETTGSQAQIATPVAPTNVAANGKQGQVLSTPASQGGYLYRGFMRITGTEMNGPKINEKIMQLGGRKAGEVDLGWRKTPTVLYYHFTIPESKVAELEALFNSYGKIKLAKEKHPRVMPEGIARYIIEVEEGQ